MIWILVAWPVLSVLAGLILGAGIRIANQATGPVLIEEIYSYLEAQNANLAG